VATAINRTVGDPQDEARQLFRNRYRELEEAASDWRIVATGAVAVVLVLAGGSIYLAVRSRYVPYVVTVDRQGFALSPPTRSAYPNRCLERTESFGTRSLGSSATHGK
jgi:type IV secretory pathway TrbF-like protein